MGDNATAVAFDFLVQQHLQCRAMYGSNGFHYLVAVRHGDVLSLGFMCLQGTLQHPAKGQH